MATYEETAVAESSMPVAALQKFIDENRIEVQAYVNLTAKLWELIVCAKREDLKRNGWIVNCSSETVQFYVYDSNDRIRLITSHKVHAQPGETIEVHGGVFQRQQEHMVVKKDDKGTAFNVKRGHLYFWNGSAMIVHGSTIEHFKNQYLRHQDDLGEMTEMSYFGVVKGGASSSNIVIVTGDGKIVSRADGRRTNHWLDGMDLCLKRINDMVVEAKKKANIPLDKPLKELGLSLSGAEKKEAQVAFVTGMKKKYPLASEVCHFRTDTFGSIATLFETGKGKGLEQCGWYWGEIKREEVAAKFKDTSDGTFLVCNSQGGQGYILTVRIGGQNRLIRIMHGNGKYGFSEPYTFNSVVELIDYYHENSLGKYNPRVDTHLMNPISRFEEEEEEEEIVEVRHRDRDSILQELVELNTTFIEKNDNYTSLEAEYNEATRKINELRLRITAQKMLLEFLKEQNDLVDRQFTQGIPSKEIIQMSVNEDILIKKTEDACKEFQEYSLELTELNVSFRRLDRKVNMSRPEIMQLKEEKQRYTDILQRMGMTKQEITEKVSERSYTETEDIYEEIYGNMDTLGDDEVYVYHEDIYEEIYGNMDTLGDDEVEEDEDDVSSSLPSLSIPPAVPPGRPKAESARVGVPVLPMSELPLRPPRYSSSQAFFGGGVSGGGPVSVSRGPLPPVPQAQPSQPTTQPTAHPRPPPARLRPQSTSGLAYNGTDSGQLTQFGPGKQEKEYPSASVNVFSDKKYWFLDINKEGSNEKLKNARDGTFLVRPTKNAEVPHHVYTVDIKYTDIHHLRVLQMNGKYGFADPCEFDSLKDMIVHYSKHQLVKHFPMFTTTLKFPINVSSQY